MTRKKGQSRPEGAAQLISLTPCLIQTLLDGLQLHLELLVLHRQPAVGILEECLEVLYALVACEEFALRGPRLLLERRILVDKLFTLTVADQKGQRASMPPPAPRRRTCFCTTVSCSRLRSKNAIFFCCALLFELRMTLLYCSLISSSWISSSTTYEGKL